MADRQRGREKQKGRPDEVKVIREQLRESATAREGQRRDIVRLQAQVAERNEKIREDAVLIQRVRDAEEAAADLRQRLTDERAGRIKAEGAKGRKDAKLAARVRELERLLQAEDDREAIHVVFDGPPGNEPGRFVEVEDGEGHGISAGEWIERKDGLWALVLRVSQGEAPSAAVAEVVFGLQQSQEALRVESGRLRLQLQTVTEERDTARQERSRATVSEERALHEIGQMKLAEEERLKGLEMEKATVPAVTDDVGKGGAS